ncbi:TlpA disulfide reductase family protein [Caenimonas aquaedulcis]|uniref:TlpA family protein disulfide reductase n=1 Tax=Caenimonas aquaedulcis TaxID=2793270 RepID=A0A931MIP5_9BURK|nr:TlpA disulfide reductase family protein [Caenimonas aquaedulcis]MBG9389958.1 TlpA family protein disulfide reductase [Caenimonas aquaedulcis]
MTIDAKRRRWLFGGVGLAAAAAGAGYGWWESHRAAAPDTDRADMLWPLDFETPGGQPLPMQSLRGKPLVVNFWATWCPPCVEELPLLDGFFREHSAKGWQVIGLAIDQPSAVRKFLARTPVTFPIGMAGLGGTELGLALGNAGGGLPFTVALDASGRVLQRKMGRLVAADLAQWVALA